MIRKSKQYDQKNLTYNGCSCHNSKRAHRSAKKGAKKREERAWKKEASDS